jgi:hypothetical protein
MTYENKMNEDFPNRQLSQDQMPYKWHHSVFKQLPSCLSVTNVIEVCNLKMLTFLDTAIVNELHGEPDESKSCLSPSSHVI